MMIKILKNKGNFSEFMEQLISKILDTKNEETLNFFLNVLYSEQKIEIIACLLKSLIKLLVESREKEFIKRFFFHNKLISTILFKLPNQLLESSYLIEIWKNTFFCIEILVEKYTFGFEIHFDV